MGKQDSTKLREQIIETSRGMLIEEGYRNLSMRKIAKKIGITATSIYIYFESKDHLLHTLIEEAIDVLNADLEQSIADIEDENPVEKLTALGKAYISFALENPKQYQIIYLVRSEEMSRYPKEKFRRARKGYQLVLQAIEEGIDEGAIRENQPLIAAYVFWAQLHGAMSVLHSERLDTRVDPQAFVQKALEHTLNGFGLKNSIVV